MLFLSRNWRTRKKTKEYLEWKDSVGKDKVMTPDELVKDIVNRLP
ncbi:MAG: hypothetical protein ACSW77_01270 [Bacteroidales bacterium]